LCFLTGLPGESAEDQRESLRFIERARARHPRVRVQAELLAIEPLAPMNVDPAGHGIVSSARGLQDYVDGHGTTGFVGYEPDTQTVEEARSRAAALVRAGRVVPIPCCRLRTGRGDPPLIQLHDISLWDEGPQQGLGIPSLIAHALADERLGDAVRFDHRSWRADLAGEGALDPAEIAAAALDARPAAVGFTMTTWSERPFLEAIRRIRAARPKLPVIVGGPLATCEGTRMMERAPGIDALVAGHGEVPFQAFSRAVADGTDADELSAALSDVGGMVLRCGDGLAGGGVAAVDVLPPDGFPSPYRLGLLDPRQGPSMNVEWSRGCAGRCAYCAWGNGLPRIVPASTDRVRQDVEFARRCGVSRINITDAALNAPGYPLAEVCAALEEASEGSGLGFTGFLRYEFLETGQLAELARVPFARLNVGLQTDDDRALRALGRPAFDGDRFRWAVNELSRIARVGVQIISALPGDTYDAFQRRLYSLLQMECDLTVFPLQAPPGTTLWENREALGIRPDPERAHVVFQTSTLGPRDHLGCLELAQRLTAAADRSAHGLSAGPGVAEGLRVHVANGPPLVQLHQANVDDAGPNFGLGVPFLISHARRQADLEGRYDLQQVPWEVDHPDRFRASVDEMVDAIVADDPLMVGFSLAPWSYVRFLEVIRRLRIRRPELGVVVGGPNACIEGETLLSDVPEIDLLVPGEGELPFAGLLRALAAGGDRLEPARLAAVPGLLTRRGGGTRRG
ncbi:MAG: cobalamin-dependent protein, partial [Myxococcota bacterium]|nr:cobalamin-dependent protein [Myxococcota bacterium]